MPSVSTDNSKPVSPIPAAAGIGLKPQHFEPVLEQKPPVSWFEVHPENYLMAGGPMHHYLTQIRERFPLSFHSVGMSFGSNGGVDVDHVHKLADLVQRYQPGLVSDHLSWSRWGHYFLNDLLPMPYTTEALKIMTNNIDHVQSLLGRPIAIENPSSYVLPGEPELSEWDFLVELARRSGSAILLDINNIYVSTNNHDWSAEQYIRSIPPELVAEVHLAGHKVEQVGQERIWIDDHGSRVCDEVWRLYELALAHHGPVPTLIEWDTDVPEFTVLLEQAQQIERRLGSLPGRMSHAAPVAMAGSRAAR